MKKVLVVGSANMDMVARVRSFPRPGETIFGPTFGMFPGGKGANQAVCCAKLGGKVEFLGKVGSDVLGDRLRKNMAEVGVGLHYLAREGSTPTGIALILVDQSGENEIVVVSGSNMKVTPADLHRNRSAFRQTGVLLTQLESPIETVTEALTIAKKHGTRTILNPAPAKHVSRKILRLVDILTPNEIEAEFLTGIPVRNLEGAKQAARRLLRAGVGQVVLTMGSRGSLLVTSEGSKRFPALKVKVVDTTAAGDAFTGALAFALADGKTVEEGVRFATGVAAYSVTNVGAQRSMPTFRALRSFLRRNGR